MLYDAGRYLDCILVLDKVIKLDPYSEELRAMFMKACLGAGDIKSVVTCYDNFAKLIKEELDCDVSPELQKVYDDIIQKRSELRI